MSAQAKSRVVERRTRMLQLAALISCTPVFRTCLHDTCRHALFSVRHGLAGQSQRRVWFASALASPGQLTSIAHAGASTPHFLMLS
jgi:hypothetical protein